MGSENDVEDIKKHVFFDDMDWNKLYEKKIEPPYKPQVKGPEDTSNFDEVFLQEIAEDSVAEAPDIEKEQSNPFADFEYMDSQVEFD